MCRTRTNEQRSKRYKSFRIVSRVIERIVGVKIDGISIFNFRILDVRRAQHWLKRFFDLYLFSAQIERECAGGQSPLIIFVLFFAYLYYLIYWKRGEGVDGEYI